MSILVVTILLLCATPFLIVLNAVVLPRLLTALVEYIWPERFAELSSVFSIGSAFHSDRPFAWETQTPLLQLVHQAGAGGISLTLLRRAYREVVRQYPELYDGFTLEQWLRFLVETQIVRRTWRRVHLTHKGRDFLQFGLALRRPSRTYADHVAITRCGMAD